MIAISRAHLNGDGYVYMDWHASGFGRVPIPDDLVGRAFEVIEKPDNITLYSKAITNHLNVNVSNSDTYGYLVLKVKK